MSEPAVLQEKLDLPTGDHTVLQSADLWHVQNPKQLTLRTRASDQLESHDSQPVHLGALLLQELYNAVGQKGTAPAVQGVELAEQPHTPAASKQVGHENM